MGQILADTKKLEKIIDQTLEGKKPKAFQKYCKKRKIPWYEDRPYKFSDNMKTVYNINDFDELLDSSGFKRTKVFCRQEYKIKMDPLMTWVEVRMK